jgi:hypothetical protein
MTTPQQAAGLSIRAKETLAVEVNHVVGRIGYPNLRLPRDVAEIFQQPSAVEKSRHKHKPRFAAGEEAFQLCQSLWVYGSVARYRLNENKPVSLDEMDDYTRYFSVSFDRNAERAQIIGIPVSPT